MSEGEMWIVLFEKCGRLNDTRFYKIYKNMITFRVGITIKTNKSGVQTMKIMEFYLHCYCGKADMSVEIAEVLIILCA